MPEMSKQELQWRAEDDARTLARAEEIKADKKRETAARSMAKKQLDEVLKRAEGLKKISKTTIKKGGKK